MLKLKSLMLGALLTVAMTVSAQAALVQGQLQWGTTGTPTYTPTTNGTALSAYTGTATFVTNVTSSSLLSGVDDFAGKTWNSGVSNTGFSFAEAGLQTFDFGTLGTFVGMIDPIETLAGANSAATILRGTFTPGTALAGFTATDANLSIQWTRTGSTVTPTISGTLSVLGTQTVVPEPGTLGLAACGVVALGLVARRRRA